MIKNVEQQWDLDALYPGGADSPQFAALLERTEADIESTLQQLKAMESPPPDDLIDLIAAVGELDARAEEARAFAVCLMRSDTADERAAAIQRRCTKLIGRLNSLYIELDRLLLQTPAIFEKGALGASACYLQERRQQAERRLAPDLENLLADYAGANVKSWAQLRQKLIARIQFPLEMEGQQKTLTGREVIHLLFTSHADPAVRQALTVKFREACAPDAELFAMALNQITELHLKTLRHRGSQSAVEDTLQANRVSVDALDAMMRALDRNLSRFTPYFAKKSERFGMEALGEADLLAPLGQSSEAYRYEDALELISELFGQFSPAMAEYVRQAAENRWIDAEDRPGKSFIEFCIQLPHSKRALVMTRFHGTYHSVSTLAHELGHAYHYHKLYEQPAFAQKIPSSMAEIASTFSEMLLTNGVLQRTGDGAERAVLLNEKLKNTMLYALKPYVQFLFQKRLFEACDHGPLSAAQLDDLMTETQRFVYQDALASYTPETWITNNFYYFPDRTFINYQYTFGYLFSAGLCALATERGELSPAQYDAFLQDTGSLNIEDLARKHLGVDLTDETFWQHSLDLLIRDVEAFSLL